jgi:hypothetical protein
MISWSVAKVCTEIQHLSLCIPPTSTASLLVHVLIAICTAPRTFVTRNVPECIHLFQHWSAGSSTGWEWKQVKEGGLQLNQQATTFWCQQGIIDTLPC